jgi:hypothetical protein
MAGSRTLHTIICYSQRELTTMLLRTIPFVIAAALLAYAGTSGAQPTKITAPPDPALQAQFKKAPPKYPASRSEATEPPDAALQARFKKGADKYQASKSEATAPPELR